MKNCINCKHFVNWDMDWCCTAQLKLLSEIIDNKTVRPENCTKDRSNCPDWKDDSLDRTPEAVQYRKEEWEFYL